MKSNIKQHILSGLTDNVYWETIVLTVLCFVDMVYTEYVVLAKLAVESNPLLAWSFSHGIWCFFVLKLMSFMIPIVIIELIKKKCPSARNWLKIGIIMYILIYIIGSLCLII